MATGRDDQPRSGYKGRNWNTEREHEPDLTQRECQSQTEWMAVGDGVYYRLQHHQKDGDLGDVASVEDRAESLPPEAESIVNDVRKEKLVTQLAVHSASVDLQPRGGKLKTLLNQASVRPTSQRLVNNRQH